MEDESPTNNDPTPSMGAAKIIDLIGRVFAEATYRLRYK